MTTIFSSKELMTRQEWEQQGRYVSALLPPDAYDAKGKALYSADQTIIADDREYFYDYTQSPMFLAYETKALDKEVEDIEATQ